MAIRLLDDSLINKIAAGEVVERPASVVKELVENSIDAGSTRIEVRISGGGIDLIEVVDNGAGIAAADVALALQRHATSKISSESDLFCIGTMGFRGEALPSIAAVSRLELYTQSGQQSGVKALLEGGRQLSLEPHSTAPGTHIIVRDIFFNTPARKKFLKSAVSEGIRLHEVVSQLALSRPDISFSFANEKKLYFKTPGNGVLLDTVAAIYGQDYAGSFLAVRWQGESGALEGLTSKPEFRRLNRKNQIFYVNQRWVRSPMLGRAIDEAYRGRLLSREYPACVLYLTIHPQEVDVNVHPQKTEVRFRDEKAVFRLVSRTIRARLDNNCPVDPTIMEAGTEWPSSSRPHANYIPQAYDAAQRRVSDDQLPFIDHTYEPGETYSEGLVNVARSPEAKGEFAVIGQCFENYILVEIDNSLWIIDQHAAHERINYNRLQASQKSPGTSAQILVFPLPFELSTAGMDLLIAQLETFHDLGFEIEVLGPNSAVVRSAPAILQGREIEVVNECLQLLEDERSLDIKRALFALIACKQSVKAGQSLTRAEMTRLVYDLLAETDFMHCPHGRPTMMEFSRLEVDKRFKRK